MNTTIQVAPAIRDMMLTAYKAIYSDSGPLGYTDEDSLQLMVAPLSACSEIVALFEKGIIDAPTSVVALIQTHTHNPRSESRSPPRSTPSARPPRRS